MTDRLLKLASAKYRLTEIPTGEFSTVKSSGMKFKTSAYHAEGLGHISVMTASGFFGLMKMDTVIIVPTELDLPLYSYDRIYAMGNDTLIVELYDTTVSEYDDSALSAVKERFAHLTERDPGEHWYDSIKLKSSISKKGKKANTPILDELAIEHFSAFINADAAPVSDIDKKRERTEYYVNGLLERGGPSTDAFIKALGREKTETLFKTVLFGTGK
jgi:hypothetical protein